MTATPLFVDSMPKQQRGVVLFVALIAMVILSLAGLALMRSIDESSGVAGNIAFRNSSMNPVNESIEEAIKTIFKAKTLPSQIADQPAFHYFAELQAGESKNGVPAVLQGSYAAMVAAYSAAGIPAPVADAVTGIELRYVVERICNFPASTPAEIIGHCDILPPKQQGGTDNKQKGALLLAVIPVFRVTVRADIPNVNAPSYAQTFVR